MRTNEIKYIALNAQLGGEDKETALLKISRLVNYGKTRGFISVSKKSKFRLNENKAQQRTEEIKDDVQYIKKPKQSFNADLRDIRPWKNGRDILNCDNYSEEDKISTIKRLLEMGEIKC